MFDFEKPNIEIVEISDDKKYGRFVCEPLERGYGTTLGNALKRIMLSALPGTAVSQVKIIGADKESDTIPGVKDTLTEVIMNLKSLEIKNTSSSDDAASTLDKDAKLEITNNIEAAQYVGKAIAEKAMAKGIKTVVFDRGGFLYHGKVQALADAAREAGLEF